MGKPAAGSLAPEAGSARASAKEARGGSPVFGRQAPFEIQVGRGGGPAEPGSGRVPAEVRPVMTGRGACSGARDLDPPRREQHPPGARIARLLRRGTARAQGQPRAAGRKGRVGMGGGVTLPE